MSDHAFDLTDRRTFTHWVTDRIRFSDTDAQGHVNNVAIAAYVETGRLMFGREIVRDTGAATAPVATGATNGSTLPPGATDDRPDTRHDGEIDAGAAAAGASTDDVVANGDRPVDDPTEESGAVLAHLSIDYRQELFFPGTVDVGSRVVRIGRSSYMVGTGVFVDERCIATATGVIVTISAGHPAPIPPQTRQRLTDLLTT